MTFISLFVALAGCGDDDGGADLPDSAGEAIVSYGALVFATYADTTDMAVELREKITAFLAEPSATSLEDARDAWRESREPYLQTEVFRFYDGPIDNPEDGPEGLVNSWPLDENHIDYVAGEPEAGIVNDPSITIDEETLVEQNQADGEENVATGYHAIEFLLWGQDESEDGPGDRPFTDFVESDDGTPNADRRAQYLRVTADLLLKNLEQVRDAWTEDASSYRSEMMAGDERDGLTKILTGMIVLSGFETGGERVRAALDSGDQEDEHSCFSDNTHRDMVQDVRGVQNVWRGRYLATDGTTVSGTGIADVAEEIDPDLAEEIEAQIAESLMLAEAIEPPFDREIRFDNLDGRARVQALADSLRTQEMLLTDLFTRLGLEADLPE